MYLSFLLRFHVLVMVLVYVAMCLSSFEIILTRKRELVVLLLLSFGCFGTVNIMWLSLKVSWVGLQFVIGYFLIIVTYFFLWKSWTLFFKF